MNQLPLFETSQWTVTRLTQYLRRLLETDDALQDIWVQGEISNFSRPASGHFYFTLKDSGAALRCVMWRSDARRVNFALQDGQAVEAHGRIGIYEPGGQYQLYVDIVRPAGEGALYQEFLRLKALLEAEGLFDPARKRLLPQLPRLIGIVTSPTGAALRDMLNTLRRRLLLVEVVLAPSPVQGEEAPPALVAALRDLDRFVHPDVILLARGGGSIEDLWAFNDERVVRAVAASGSPVITGVGHETDFTLVDFASDLRAPTPTAAAELATPLTTLDLSAALQADLARLNDLLRRELFGRSQLLAAALQGLHFYTPARRLLTERQRLDELSRQMTRALGHRLSLEHAHVNGARQQLESLNPLGVLRRGYAVVTRREDGRLVYTAKQAPAGSDLHVHLAEGALDVRVQSPSRKEE